jgi:hypothetical protein
VVAMARAHASLRRHQHAHRAPPVDALTVADTPRVWDPRKTAGVAENYCEGTGTALMQALADAD